ncbi:polyribonucleotide nucleotidyltransferase [Tautonia plasticadhaerens]|uniref:Polyribonucleotide nucleotidyltransferase n=1 Tax=Tautonia plasticadhaerens TaxID=2527974 RepID=A0A518GZ69_9BACT|nr:polyribonucleotide nucleotidyltransferase [Tautonia plasticadhaerens]QDV33888.1 Polyribonucleotide nucleotidyltransferase [Tautonia plasticadhaerens]
MSTSVTSVNPTKKHVVVERTIGGKTITIETGKLAKQATGSVVVRLGDTMTLVATVVAPGREGLDFFPMMVDYREKVYAAGKFPGGFIKREGRPSTKEILTSRLTDRPIRPLFPSDYRMEVQIQAGPISADRVNDPDILTLIGASATLCISPDVPFLGPLGTIRLGRIDGQLVTFPTAEEMSRSDLDLIVASTREKVTMIEGFGKELPEPEMLEAILEAHKLNQELIDLQLELREKLGMGPMLHPEPRPDPLQDELHRRYAHDLREVKKIRLKQERNAATKELQERVVAELCPEPGPGQEAPEPSPVQVKAAFYALQERVVRELILDGHRSDGRGPKDLRMISCEVEVLPCVHGSALFQRGETQALVTTVLGTGADEQRVDGIMDEYSKKFYLDYNMPHFAVGEVRPIRGPGRREIGHGMLAERSVAPILPDPARFPYTIRVVSDILESNGSSSMASVCGATLSLMDAGVPISDPVGGISIGLVEDQKTGRYILLTDIIGDEDHFGDMDFKVAGTQHGITGIQLDVKNVGLTEEIIRGTLDQAREARVEILRSMLRAIKRPRDQISMNAPRLIQIQIDPQKIGMLIGPGGKTIRRLQEETGTKIDIEDTGVVTIASASAAGAEECRDRIEGMTAGVQLGKIYEGRVMSVKDFGAFVELLPGQDGMVHISELTDGYINSVSDVCRVGDQMLVKVIAIDEQDRVKLSRRQALAERGLEDTVESKPRPPAGEGGGGGDRGPRPSGGDRGPRPSGGDRDRGRGPGGPPPRDRR